MDTPDILHAVAGWFRALNARTGVDLSIFYDPVDASRFYSGVLTTIEMALICIVLSVVIGVVVAGLQQSRHKTVVWLLEAYVQFFRNTPSVVQLYFFFFGVGPLLAFSNEYGQSVPVVSSFSWSVICLSIYAGAFNAEIFRAGIDSVNRATVEAAESLGYSRTGAYLHVILPLAFRHGFPAFVTNTVNLIKATSIAYAIAVPETLYMTSQIWSERLNVVEMMNVMLVVYVLVVSVFLLVARRVERWMRVPGFGA